MASAFLASSSAFLLAASLAAFLSAFFNLLVTGLLHGLSLLGLLLGLPLGGKLGSLPLSLLLLPLLSLLLLLLLHLLLGVCNEFGGNNRCCCGCGCGCCLIHWCQGPADEVVRQACNESPSCVVDDRVFRELATLDCGLPLIKQMRTSKGGGEGGEDQDHNLHCLL